MKRISVESACMAAVLLGGALVLYVFGSGAIAIWAEGNRDIALMMAGMMLVLVGGVIVIVKSILDG